MGCATELSVIEIINSPQNSPLLSPADFKRPKLRFALLQGSFQLLPVISVLHLEVGASKKVKAYCT